MLSSEIIFLPLRVLWDTLNGSLVEFLLKWDFLSFLSRESIVMLFQIEISVHFQWIVMVHFLKYWACPFFSLFANLACLIPLR